MKTCNTCLVEKDKSEFYGTNKYLNNHCKKCNTAKSKAWYAKNREVKLAAALKWYYKDRYGMTLEQRQELFNKQDGKCAICSCTMHLEGNLNATQAVIDHCHDSGKIRGMLCNLCNAGLGHFKDNIQSIERAIKYLEEK